MSFETLRCCIGVKPVYLRGKILPVSVVNRSSDSVSKKVKFSGFRLFVGLVSSVDM